MKLLLDSCTFIWGLWNPERLSQKARVAFLDDANERYMSYVSVWEMTIKFQLGKMPFQKPPGEWVEIECNRHAINLLPLSLNDIYRLASLPSLHRDPFDRLLVAQAIQGHLTLLTNDSAISAYPVSTIW